MGAAGAKKVRGPSGKRLLDWSPGFTMLRPVPLLGEVSNGIVFLVIIALVVVGVIVAVSMGKGK